MACANVDLRIDQMDELPLREMRRREAVVTRQYQATELIPNSKAPLHSLLQKQPAVLGSLQVASGLLSVGMGVIAAVTQNIDQSLFALFRVSQMTGAMFIIAGLASNLLFRFPELLSACLMINCGCLFAAFVAVPLIIVDLTRWDSENEFLKMEILELCILALESLLSGILCFWFAKGKQTFSP